MTMTTSTSHRSSSSSVVATSIAQRPGRDLHIWCSTRSDGDFHRLALPFDELDARRRSFVDLPWIQLDQRHGVDVVRVDTDRACDGQVGDVAITALDDVVLGCWVADCASVVLIGAESEFAIVHAGWRGLAAGVLQAAFDAFTEPVTKAVLGSAIGPCCYEFGSDQLEQVAAGVGSPIEGIVGSTSATEQALDVPAAVTAACGDVPVVRLAGCTGCDFPGFSHRVRRDPQRHVVAVWRRP